MLYDPQAPCMDWHFSSLNVPTVRGCIWVFWGPTGSVALNFGQMD